MGSSLHYFSYCYPLPVIDTFSGIMLAQQILLGANSSAAIIHSPDLKAFFICHLLATFIGPFQIRFRSVSSPFLRMGEKWDLQGNHKGGRWELQYRLKEYASRIKP